jgi:nucleoside-diphosphate-sugar epimerase
MAQIIVSGATGFIGSAFVKNLIDEGFKVVALGRKNFDDILPYRQVLLKGACYIKIDLKDIDQLGVELASRNILLDPNCVFFHLAWGGKLKLSDLDLEHQMSNVYKSVSALEEALKIGCKRFIHVGSMEEEFALKYLKLDYRDGNYWNRHLIYAIAKISAKNALILKSIDLGIDFIFVNHSHVMGPGDDKDSFLQVTLQNILNSNELVFSSGNQIFDVISLSDCIEAYKLICLDGKSGSSYWVGSGDPRLLREYVERMYSLFPSNKHLLFGALSYNDVELEMKVFSTKKLELDTSFKPKMSYEDAVVCLYEYLISIEKENQT